MAPLIKGIEFLQQTDWYAWAGKFAGVLGLIGAFVVSGIVLYFVYRYIKDKKLYNVLIVWFDEVHGETKKIGTDWAKEITITTHGKNVKLFYVKRLKMFLPRGNYKMGAKEYWYSFLPNHQVENFSLKNINIDRMEAGLNYDHTDMLYQRINLEKIIDEKYKNKNTQWWKQYAMTISAVIVIFVAVLAVFFILGMADKSAMHMAEVGKNLAEATKNFASLVGSGVASK